MRIKQILGVYNSDEVIDNLRIIRDSCSDFLRETNKLPLYRLLPSTYSTFHRVKVRVKEHKHDVSTAITKAFEHACANLYARSIFTTPSIPTVNRDNYEPFYVFIPNGFKFLYCKHINSVDSDVKVTLEALQTLINGNSIVVDLLRQVYKADQLREGIESDAEIMFYKVPYFFAVKMSAYPTYEMLLDDIY